jgi:phosphopantetheine adenylyltransferase
MASDSNLIKLTSTNQINTKQDIIREYKKISVLFKNYDRFDSDNKKLILDTLRRLSNRILQLTQGYLNSNEIDKEILLNYNREISRLKRFLEGNKKGLKELEKFNSAYYNDISKKNIENIKRDYL